MPSWCCGGGVWIITLGIVLLVTIATGALLLVRGFWGRDGQADARPGQAARHGDASAVLEEQHARGDIDDEEFDARRRNLISRTSVPQGQRRSRPRS